MAWHRCRAAIHLDSMVSFHPELQGVAPTRERTNYTCTNQNSAVCQHKTDKIGILQFRNSLLFSFHMRGVNASSAFVSWHGPPHFFRLISTSTFSSLAPSDFCPFAALGFKRSSKAFQSMISPQKCLSNTCGPSARCVVKISWLKGRKIRRSSAFRTRDNAT